MANYDSSLTGAQIESALEAVNGLIGASNNGKIICVENGALAAKSAIEIQGGTIDAITITENGVYTHTSIGGYSPITVNVGGSIGMIVSAVKAIYESGYTCIATDGTTTLTSNTSGTWMFGLPNAGTWTFSCNGVSRTINVLVYRYYAVYLDEFYIYKSGDGAIVNLYTYCQSNATLADNNEKITIGISGLNNQQSCARTSSTIDITDYNTLTFDLECTALGGESAYQGRFIVSSTTFSVDTFNQEIAERIVVNSTRHTKTIDVSSLTGNMYIGTSGAWAGNIYNIYLE